MNWTKEKPPTEGISHYNHTTLRTPIGMFIIAWKGWKERPEYSIMLDNEYIGTEYDLESAKSLAKNYLIDLANSLNEFVNQHLLSVKNQKQETN